MQSAWPAAAYSLPTDKIAATRAYINWARGGGATEVRARLDYVLGLVRAARPAEPETAAVYLDDETKRELTLTRKLSAVGQYH